MTPPNRNKTKSVRFDTEIVNNDNNEDSDSRKRNAPNRRSIISQQHQQLDVVTKKQKKHKNKKERPNEDEMDDIDEWNEGDDDNDDEHHNHAADYGIASERDLMEAKRQRRFKRTLLNNDSTPAADGIDNDDNNDRIDHRTSLASEGIEIEPFHMENEKNDGTGYFDGDTYIFRRGKRDGDTDEPDAWLDNLTDTTNDKNEDDEKITHKRKRQQPDDDENEDDSGFDHWSEEELYAKIVPLVSDTETVMQAIIRYGTLLKRNSHHHHNVRKPKATNQETSTSHDAPDDHVTNRKVNIDTNPSNLAQNSLNELTVASNALLLKGKVNIYQMTRVDIEKLLKSTITSTSNNNNENTTTNADSTTDNNQERDYNKSDSKTAAWSSRSVVVQWQYQGSQDGQIHGPYTTQQMIGWIQAGYFTGPSAVHVRTVETTKTSSSYDNNNNSNRNDKKSLQDDLLSDLMDDDDDKMTDNHNGSEYKDPPSDKNNLEDQSNNCVVYGEWMRSDQIDFVKYK